MQKSINIIKSIPVYILEEHHEAFLIWSYARIKGIIKECNNSLIHFDSHSDMGIPFLREPITDLNNSIRDIYNFTYNQLGISTFLIPSIYRNFFNHVYWFFPKEGAFKVGSKNLYVRTYKEEGRLFISGPDPSPWPDEKPWQDKVFYEMHHRTLSHDIANVENAILDIDLDFFSCEIYINTINKLEVTAKEYKKFIKDKYHFLRLKGNCYVESLNGNYYIHMNSNQSNEVVTKAKLTNEEILKKIDLFCSYLEKNKIKPQMINISRSRISGYTPDDQCDFIEKNLIKGLRNIYKIRRFYINDMKEFKK